VLNFNVATAVVFKFKSNETFKQLLYSLHTLAVFTDSIDVSVTYLKLVS